MGTDKVPDWALMAAEKILLDIHDMDPKNKSNHVWLESRKPLIGRIIMRYIPALLWEPDDVEIPDDHETCPKCGKQTYKADYHRDVSDVYVECKCGYRRLLATVGQVPIHILEDPEFIKVGRKIEKDLLKARRDNDHDRRSR